MERDIDGKAWEGMDGPEMEFDDRVPLHRVVEMQGFDANEVATRDVFVLIDWTRGRGRRRYDLSLVFDGAQRGLDAVLSDYEGSALCVGRGSVHVGVDDLISMTFGRRFDSGGKGASTFILAPRRRVSLPVAPHREPARIFGPFSVGQQNWAAGPRDDLMQTLYGFRVLWPADESSIEERCFVLRAHSIQDACALLSAHVRGEYPHVHPQDVVVEVDDMRLETVVSDFSLFTASRTSHLDEFAFIEAFRLGPVVQ